ncbi:MAG: beta-propeller domain-containing protein [Candidatus Izemoplasmatales bacterium]
MKKFIMMFFMIFSAIVFISCQSKPTEIPTGDNVGSFSSYEQLGDYLKEFYDYNTEVNRWYSLNSEVPLGTPEAGAVEDSVNFDQDEERDYSKTNNQVEGVDEADTILTDGYYIYIISGNKFFMVDAETLDIVYIYYEESMYFEGLYIYEDKIVLLGNYYVYLNYEYPEGDDTEDKTTETGDTVTSDDTVMIEPSYYPIYWNSYHYGTKIVVLDKSDITNVEVSRELMFDESYIASSRMIDGYLYLIMNNYSISYYYEEDSFVPQYMDSVVNDELEDLPVNQIFFMPNDSENFSYLLLASFKVDDDEEASIKAYLGSTYQIYMSAENLYTTVYRFKYDYMNNTYEDKTFILRFAIENNELAYKAFSTIDGMPLNQFSMDEYDGVFRIAVTDYNYSFAGAEYTNTMFLFDATTDDEMTLISSLEGLGKPGERIYAVRFSEETAYVVTFVNTDPLYKLDLSDPVNPAILGEFYEEGVSDYLHVITDNLMIGVGRQAETDEYDRTFFTGVKIALYDTSGDTPTNIETYLVEGEYSYTNVSYNHKYFMSFAPIDEDFTYIAIPVSLYSNNYSRYSQNMFVFKVHHSGDLELVAQLEQTSENYFDSIEKAVMIENYIYTLSYSQIQVFDMDNDFSFVKKVVINETYYYDYPVTEEPVETEKLD